MDLIHPAQERSRGKWQPEKRQNICVFWKWKYEQLISSEVESWSTDLIQYITTYRSVEIHKGLYKSQIKQLSSSYWLHSLYHSKQYEGFIVRPVAQSV